MIPLEPLIEEARQAKGADCYAQLDPQTLIELCMEMKILRAENALLRIGSGQTAPCQTKAFCYYNVSDGCRLPGSTKL